MLHEAAQELALSHATCTTLETTRAVTFLPNDHAPTARQVDKTLGWRPRLERRAFPAVDGHRVVWAPSPQALLQSFPQRFLVNFGCVGCQCSRRFRWSARRLCVPAASGAAAAGCDSAACPVCVLGWTSPDKLRGAAWLQYASLAFQ